MILELDRLRAFYLDKFGEIGPAIGVGDKVARQVIEAWVEAGRSVVVVWGPPGAGKSRVLNKYDAAHTLVTETTGLAATMNKFFRGLPKSQVRFVLKTATRATCKDRLTKRADHPMGSDPAKLLAMVDRWFDTPKRKMLG